MAITRPPFPCLNNLLNILTHSLSRLPTWAHVVRACGAVADDKWQLARSAQSWDRGRHAVNVTIISDPTSSNMWRFIIGAIPAQVLPLSLVSICGYVCVT